MEEFRKIEVVLLPTEEGDLWFYKDNKDVLLTGLTVSKSSNINSQHLYFLSDDKIEVGDWCLLDHNVGVSTGYSILKCLESNIKEGEYLFQDKDGNKFTTGRCSKIIATTDSSLGLVKPSQQFIRKYAEAYNEGKPITHTMVMYEDKFTRNEEIYVDANNCKGNYSTHSKQLKLNPRDNTIIINKLKDSWNREEVIDLLHRMSKLAVLKPSLTEGMFNNWIQENL